MATFQGKQDLSSVDSHVPGLTGFTERPKRSFDTPSSAKKCFIQLGCCPHLQFWDAPVLQQPMGCVLGLSTCKNHVPSHCSAHKLPLEISNLFFLGFPPVLTWVTVQWLLILHEHSPATASHSSPREPWNLPLAAAGRSQRSKSVYTLSWQWLYRHLAAQSIQAPTVFTHTSLLQSQRHPNWLVLHTTEQDTIRCVGLKS